MPEVTQLAGVRDTGSWRVGQSMNAWTRSGRKLSELGIRGLLSWAKGGRGG